MQIESLAIPDVKLIRPPVFGDGRGYVSETFSAAAFARAGLPDTWVQDNESFSRQLGTLRGLHFQHPPTDHAKLVRVVRGAIFDVAVDLRRGSPHCGRWVGTELRPDPLVWMLIPRGFAHAFCTLAPDTVVHYKLDGPYAPDQQGGLAWDDPQLAIDWPLPAGQLTLSDKDRAQPGWDPDASPFQWEGAA